MPWRARPALAAVVGRLPHRNRVRPGPGPTTTRRGGHLCRKGPPADHPLMCMWLRRRRANLRCKLARGGQAADRHALARPAHRDRAAARRSGRPPRGGSRASAALPSTPVAHALLRAAIALGVKGVAAPSANRFGRISPTQARLWSTSWALACWCSMAACQGGMNRASSMSRGPPCCCARAHQPHAVRRGG